MTYKSLLNGLINIFISFKDLLLQRRDPLAKIKITYPDKNDAAVLLIDHQTGLFNLVRDFEPIQFKNNVLALADSAKFFNLPTILTTSFDNGPNGPLLPEIIEMFPEAPLIRRPGQINAWDNEEFVAAVKKTGKKQLIIAGIVTDVCVAFAALSAVRPQLPYVSTQHHVLLH